MGVNSLQWYYIPSLGKVGEIALLAGDEWHHCYHVMRLSTGDSIILTDGKGSCMEGRIMKATSNEGLIELTDDRHEDFDNHRRYKASIGFAPTKNIDRTEFAVEKLVELGIDEICFLDCNHSERNRIRIDRFEKIIVAASKQSRKIFFTKMVDVTTPLKFIQQKKYEQPEIEILCCHLDVESRSVYENYSPGKDALLLIGPEGGFSQDEIEMMRGQNAKFIHLGPFRLRVETAAIAACGHIHLINEINQNLQK